MGRGRGGVGRGMEEDVEGLMGRIKHTSHWLT